MAAGPGDGLRSIGATPTAALTPVQAFGGVTLAPGETLVAICCGGGGYGPPFERDPERVRHDVLEGWVSPERALQVYGLVLDAAGAIDAPATIVARARA